MEFKAFQDLLVLFNLFYYFYQFQLSRISIKFLFLTNFKKSKNKTNVLIYGAGSAGRQLLTSLESNLRDESCWFFR